MPEQKNPSLALEPGDIRWLTDFVREQAEGGHCGEGTLERNMRQQHNERVERVLAALSSPSPVTRELISSLIFEHILVKVETSDGVTHLIYDGLNEAADAILARLSPLPEGLKLAANQEHTVSVAESGGSPTTSVKSGSPHSAGHDGIRALRQVHVHQWCAAAFGADHAASVPQRGVRFLEEAIELYQAIGGERAMAHKLLDYIFDKPAGEIGQEFGGVGVTILALAEAAGISADDAEELEFRRVLAKPLAHFHARNKVKNDAGFDVTGGAYPTGKPGEPTHG